MQTTIEGRVYKVGNDVDTDVIIPARFLTTMDSNLLRPHLFEDLPNAPKYEGETIVVAGRNFGCGSSREHAPIAIGAAGIQAVIAKSFARIYLRNCIAGGKPFPITLLDSDNAEEFYRRIEHGDSISIDLEAGRLHTPLTSYVTQRFSDVQREILEAGGLYNLAERELADEDDPLRAAD